MIPEPVRTKAIEVAKAQLTRPAFSECDGECRPVTAAINAALDAVSGEMDEIELYRFDKAPDAWKMAFSWKDDE